MSDIRYRVLLEEFKIIKENESSADEPYLWVFHIRLDGKNLHIFDADKSGVHVYSPPGSHGNLGSKGNSVYKTSAPIKIPAKIGRYESYVHPGNLPGPSVTACTIATVIVGLEEDASPSSGTIEEARKKLVIAIRAELNKALRKLIRDGKFDKESIDAVAGNISFANLQKVVEDTVKGEVIRNFALGFLFPLFFIGVDPDDFVGFKIEGPYNFPRLLSSVGSSIPITAILKRGDNSEGIYRVTGKIEVLDPQFQVHIGAACWRVPGSNSDRIIIAGRNPYNNRYHRSISQNGGGSWSSFNPIGQGVFLSGPSVCASGNGSRLHVFGRGLDKKYWRAMSNSQGSGWNLAWAKAAEFEYDTPPASAVSSDGKNLYVIGRFKDTRFYIARSQNDGSSFSAWLKIGEGLFTSAPAVCTSSNGAVVHVFGKGRDGRIWQARSDNYAGDKTWNIAWNPMGSQKFLSAPACACDSTGNKIVVVARNTNQKLMYSISTNRGTSWSTWKAYTNGLFISSPAVAISPDGNTVYTFGIGNNMNMYFLKSALTGVGWAGKWNRINNLNTFF